MTKGARVFPPVYFTPTEIVDHRSRATGRDYRIFIAPALSKSMARGRPLLVVLDGNAYHATLSMVARSRGFLNSEIDEPHVVSIGYPSDDLEDWLLRRNLDLTPTQPTTARFPGEDLSPQLWGGSDALLQMIEDEVIPLVADRCNVDRQRVTLFGHSLGGLAVLHAFFTRPAVYSNFLAVSPSLWWEDGRVLNEECDAFLATPVSGDRMTGLFMAVGALEEGPPKIRPAWPYATPEWLQARANYTRMVSRLEELGMRLAKQAERRRLNIRTLVMNGETHASAPFAALTQAFDLAFPPNCDAPAP